MVKVTQEQIAEIKRRHNEIMRKLNESIEGTVAGEAGLIRNINAACLIRSAIHDETMILNVINKAEDDAARAGEINGPVQEESAN